MIPRSTRGRCCARLAGLILASIIATTAHGQGIRVTTDSADQFEPAVSGDRIVWTDRRSGTYDIYAYDIAAATERPICTAYRGQVHPDIDGDLIVWADDRGGSGWSVRYDLFMYDLSTDDETRVVFASGRQFNPAIHGTWIAWTDDSDDATHMMDVTDPTSETVWAAGWPNPPDIWGTRAVCLEKGDNFVPNVYLYDLATATEQVITNTEGFKQNVRICGDRVVWDERRNGNWDIFMYDLATETEIRLTNDPADQIAPAISEAAVVWVDKRDDPDGDIYLYDLSLGTTLPLVTEPHAQSEPDIDGNRVVWTDTRNGNKDIYYLDYERPSGADLQVTVDVQPSPVVVGDYLVYHIEVRNNGPDPVENTVLTNRLDERVEYISGYGTRGTCRYFVQEGRKLVVCPTGDLQPGWVGEATIVVRVLESGRITNHAHVDPSAGDLVPANNDRDTTTPAILFYKKDLGPGWAPRLATDATGAAHVVFIRPPGHDDTGGDVVYATNRPGRWTRDVLFRRPIFTCPGCGISCAPNPEPARGFHYRQAVAADIAVQADGTVHVAYVVDDVWTSACTGIVYEETMRLEYVHNRSGHWSEPVVVAEGIVADNGVFRGGGISSMDLEVDAAGRAHVIFMNTAGGPSQGDLVYCTNAGGSWQSQVLATAYCDAALALDSAGCAHVAFYTWTGGAGDGIMPPPDDAFFQGIAYTTNAPDGVWQPAQPVESNWGGCQMETLVCDIAVDRQDRPHISYVSNQGSGPEDYRHAVLDAGVWQHHFIEAGQCQGGPSRITIDPADRPVVAYPSDVEHGLVAATWVVDNAWDRQYITPGDGLDGIVFDIAGDLHAVGRDDGRVFYYHTRGPDDDHDGISNAFESGPTADDPDYDGNGDGIPDSQQQNVCSFYTNNDYGYVTVSGPNDLLLGNVGVEHNPAEPDTPDDWNFVFDFVHFMVMGIPIGGDATIILDLPEGSAPEVYYKYGPTHMNHTPHWYPFMYDGQTGAEIDGDRIILHFVDGQRGDNDLSSNGIIIDPGAPGLYDPCIVDLDDLAALAAEWTWVTPTVPELHFDLDDDGRVDAADFAVMAALWQQPCPPDWPDIPH